MKRTLKPFALGAAVPFLLLADFSTDAPLGLGLASDAVAVVGAPMTPVSYAGVARRTTRRTVAVTSTAAAASAASVTAASQQPQQQQPQAAPPLAPPPGSLPVGTVVSALPPGCVSAPIGGVEYYLCSGTYYRPAFQGNNLVYVVQKP